jgi:hypothetical protein
MMNVETVTLRDITSCSLVDTDVSESPTASIFGVELTGSYGIIGRNVPEALASAPSSALL